MGRTLLLATATIVLLLECTAAGAAENIRLGIMPLLAGDDVLPTATRLTDEFASELTRRQYSFIEVLDRTEMRRIIQTTEIQSEYDQRELERALTGSCSEESCVQLLAQYVRAEFMLAGSYREYRGRRDISVRMTDPSTGRTISVATNTFEVAVSLDEIARELSYELISKLSGAIVPTGLPSDATLLVDNYRERWAPGEPVPVSIGHHILEARRTGFRTAREAVQIRFNETRPVQFLMEPLSRAGAFTRSLFFPGWGQHYSGRIGRGYLYQVLELGALAGVGATVYMNMSANDDYDAAKSEYLNLGADGSGTTVEELNAKRAVMLDKYDAIGETETYVLAALGAFAGLHAINALDALLGFPDLEDVRFVRRPDGGNALVLTLPLPERRAER